MNRLSTWCVGVATLLFLTVVCFWDYYPPIAGPQRLGVVLPDAPVGTREPLIVTGQAGAGEFLFVHYVGDRRVVFGYDSWGHGGPSSPPIPITPGVRQELEVQMPSLAAVTASPEPASPLLRVVVNGTVVLEALVNFRRRGPLRAYFARNPLGGTSCGAEFTGQLTRDDGRPLIGATRSYFTRGERFRHWLWFGRWQVLTLGLVSGAAAWTWHRMTFSRATDFRAFTQPFPTVETTLRTHRTFLLTAAFCGLAFTTVLTNGTFRLVTPESFGNFYDFQAMSLLQFRLDVPEEALSGEAFIYAGKTYGYFGITPALLRLPFVIFGVAFGELSRAAMLVYYAATLVGAYLLLLDATRLLRPSRPGPPGWQTILFTAHVGLGSTVFFLGSRAYIYHEAILCGIMFAVFSCWCALRHLGCPSGRWWLGALVLGVLSVHARPPTGFFALTVLGCVAVATMLPFLRSRPFSLRALRRPLAIGALAVAGVASFNALSYAKFRTFEGCPLRYNVQYSPKRLAKIDSKQFHVANIPYGIASYLYHPTIEVSPRFPWLYLAHELPTARFPAAKLDLPDRTMALPYGMTGLFALAILVGAWACAQLPAARPPILTLWVAFIPTLLAMAAAIAVAERYTGDFVPFLIAAAAFGLAAPVWRPAAIAALAAATLWACLLTFAMAIHYQGAMVWGVPDDVKQSYEQLRDRVDGIFLGRRPSVP
ncbi:MAG: hypothetical protein NTV51_26235 [Verrucomicrobia bacterium]|nr:hypothetical protein [Verrucomicrobiota bacterium]